MVLCLVSHLKIQVCPQLDGLEVLIDHNWTLQYLPATVTLPHPCIKKGIGMTGKYTYIYIFFFIYGHICPYLDSCVKLCIACLMLWVKESTQNEFEELLFWTCLNSLFNARRHQFLRLKAQHFMFKLKSSCSCYVRVEIGANWVQVDFWKIIVGGVHPRPVFKYSHSYKMFFVSTLSNL